MLSSITPLGERGRSSRWSVTVAAYLVGSAAGGTAVGLLLGALGRALPLHRGAGAAAALAVLAAFAVVATAVEAGRLPQLPTWHRQVDEDWLTRYRGWVYGVGFGAQLGAGLVTIVTSPLLYVALALELLSGSAPAGAALGLVFGVARAVPVLAMRPVTSFDRLQAAHRRLADLAAVGRRVTAATLVAVAVAAAALLVTTGGSP
ncbi:MAG TPA: sulfite exporter TauE/SafE family protein [Frankiaceae bacterium]